MRVLRQLVVRCGVYAALVVAITWPAAARLGTAVPGAARSDLWNSLWSLWLVSRWSEGSPLRTELLDLPDGGTLLVSDPLGAVALAPVIPLVGLPAAYTLLVLARLCMSGLVAHGFAEELIADLAGVDSGPLAPDPAARHPAAWVAGVGYATAPVLLSGVHNGTSEAFGGAWAAAAAWACWRVARRGGWRRAIVAGLLLWAATLASWYGAVVAFLFGVSALGLAAPGWRAHLPARAGALALGLALAVPTAMAARAVVSSPDNLIRIKHPRELAQVRRSTGPADPLVYVRGGDWRSPDFRIISRYGEDFVHCTYLGWALLIVAAPGARRRGAAFLLAAGGTGLALSLGPVWVTGGGALIIFGDRAIPLPYFLLEGAPGFGSLSLLYRLGQAPALAISLLAAVGLSGRSPRVICAVAAAVLLEGRLLAPTAGLPVVTDAAVSSAITALAEAPDGGVMNFPVAGGRRYLYEQTVHGKPLAGTLNFANNRASKRVWSLALRARELDWSPEEVRERVAREARKRGLRYLVIHDDPEARPDMHDDAVAVLRGALESLAAADGVEVLALW